LAIVVVTVYAATFETAEENNPELFTAPGLYLFVAESHKSAWPLDGAIVVLSTAIAEKTTLLEEIDATPPSEPEGLISLGLILVVIYRCLLFF
jgi:hypothetical protein